MTNCVLANADWLLTAQRVAIHLPTATAVVADLHLGYDLTRLCGGDAAPVVPMEVQLAPLQQILSERGIRRLLVAGDLFEGACSQSLIPAFQTWLRENEVGWFGLVSGNHDKHMTFDGFPIKRRGFKLGEWAVVHGDEALPTGRVVQGHLHPTFRWTDHAAGPCYLVSAQRIVLPAFSTDCAGLDVLGSHRWKNYRCCVIAGERVLDMGRIGNLASRTMPRPGKPRAKRFSPGRHQRGF
jgi:putative SbcD/Mre11-related phosphoesterase